MYKTTLKIDGMACSMCESHVCDAIRNGLLVRKVTASHKKGEAILLSDQPIGEQTIANALAPTGYTLLSFTTEPYEKKPLFGFLKK